MQDFHLGRGGAKVIFLEKCSLLVDRLGHTSECYTEVQQKGGTRPPAPPGYAPVLFCICLHGFSNQTKILFHKKYVQG